MIRVSFRLLLSIALPFFVSLTAVSPQQLIDDVHCIVNIKADDLPKDQPTKPSLKGDTQTEAFLRVHESYVKSTWPKELKKYKKIIDACKQKERDLYDSHYVFYHGQRDSFRVHQDLLRKIYEFVHIEPVSNFEFARYWREALQTVQAETYLDKNTPWPGDYNNPHQSQVLSTNLSLFGNVGNTGSCTFHYFLTCSNLGFISIKSLLERAMRSFGFDKSYAAQLDALASKYATSEGLLLQLFVPKSSVDTCVYLSHAGGTPYGCMIVPAVWDALKWRHTKISPILDLYQQNPFAISGINDLQARIVFSQDLAANPNSNIKIFRYDTMTPGDKAAYEAELDQIIDEMLRDWLINERYKKTRNEKYVMYTCALGNLLDGVSGRVTWPN